MTRDGVEHNIPPSEGSDAVIDGARSQVKALRGALGLTQEQLAQRLDVSFATVNRWETGRRVPSNSSRRRLDALAVAASAPTDRPCTAATTSDHWPTTVVLPLTAFTGREVELGAVELLMEANRLVTVTGPGGSGKTRLVMELIRRTTRPGEQVVVVGLEKADHAAAVAPTVVAALGLRAVARSPADDQMIAYLATRPMLLVLDNCEHVVETVRVLVCAAMTAYPQLRVLATSQIVLNLEGEQVWAIPPMKLPAPASGLDDLIRCDAGRLFVERAKSRQPGFALDADSAAAVAEICRLLDGLPLALELAAAWSAVLSPIELAARLKRSLALLDEHGTRPSDGRHRTLRATLERSEALLEVKDRRLLARLSIFVGRFTLADAEAVVADEENEDVVPGLRRLVDSSWVGVEQDQNETTYGMLNTLRAYALELLERDGATAAVRARHAEVFTTVAEASESGLAGSQQEQWRARMNRATGEIEAALEWAASHGESNLSLRLVASLWRWWYTTGRIVEGRRWTTAALGRYPAATPSLRARALYAAAMLASENGDYATAAAQAQSARREFEAIGDHRGAARASTVLGNVAKYHGDVVAARTHLAAAVASQRASGDDWGTAVALQNLASLVIDQDELRHGRELMEESLALKRRAGDRRSLGYGLINLSDLHLREGMPERALAALAEAATIAGALGDDRLAAFVEHNLGDADIVEGDSVQAAQHYRRALEGFLLVHDLRDAALALCSLGQALLLAGERREGIIKLHESESLAAEIDDELRLSEARAALTANDLPPATVNLPGRLTARQVEILRVMSAGLSNRDIAAHLKISDGTVARHIANIYRKIGANNRVGAVRYALAHGLGVAAVKP